MEQGKEVTTTTIQTTTTSTTPLITTGLILDANKFNMITFENLEKIVGEPIFVDVTEYRTIKDYEYNGLIFEVEDNGRGEIIFVDFGFDNIHVDSDREAFEILGLKYPRTQPRIQNQRLKRWEPYGNYERVTIYYEYGKISAMTLVFQLFQFDD